MFSYIFVQFCCWQLRQESNSKAELIQYNRPDKEGPKLSTYHITSVEVGMLCVCCNIYDMVSAHPRGTGPGFS